MAPQMRQLVGNLEASVQAMQDLLDGLLDLSRLEAGAVQVHPEHAYAKKHHNSLGKTEMWHILAADPGSTIALGFNRVYDAATVRARHPMVPEADFKLAGGMGSADIRPDCRGCGGGSVHPLQGLRRTGPARHLDERHGDAEAAHVRQVQHRRRIGKALAELYGFIDLPRRKPRSSARKR